MNNAEFWASVNGIISDGLYINDFHRANSMAAQREVQQMSLHPYSREQMLQQIESFKNHSISKQNANEERRRKG
jgi:hypothetical protein